MTGGVQEKRVDSGLVQISPIKSLPLAATGLQHLTQGTP